MRRTLLSLSVLTCAITLAGCSNPFGQQGYLRDKAGDYTAAKAAGPVKLPEGSNAKDFGDILVIPETGQALQQLPREFEVPRPVQRLSLNGGENYSLERNGANLWLLAGKSPAEIWPGILGFLTKNNVPVSSKNPSSGMIETAWSDFADDEEQGVIYHAFAALVGIDNLGPMEDRFRFEIRNGVKENTSEIYLAHQGRPLTKEGKKPAPVPEQWDNLDKRSKNLDESVLGELMVYLADNAMDTSVSKLAQNLNVGSLTDMAKDGNGNPVLTIRELSYARAWASVSDALDSAGLTVIDRNRSAGVFYLAENPEEIDKPVQEKGFWSELFGSDDKKTNTINPDDQESLTVRVSNFPDVVQVSVEKSVNTSASIEISEKLLKLIQENLK